MILRRESELQQGTTYKNLCKNLALRDLKCCDSMPRIFQFFHLKHFNRRNSKEHPFASNFLIECLDELYISEIQTACLNERTPFHFFGRFVQPISIPAKKISQMGNGYGNKTQAVIIFIAVMQLSKFLVIVKTKLLANITLSF